MTSLLLEIGVEELPASYVDAAMGALPALLGPAFTEARLPFTEMKAYGTPRRVAVLVQGLPEATAPGTEELLGPPESAAFKDGVPTKAAQAFADKCGVPVAELRIVEKSAEGKQKAGRYVVGTRTLQAQATKLLVGPILTQAIAKIPFRKSMRWGEGSATFGRPVQWLVALLDSTLVDVEFGGIRASSTSYGHRFLAPDAVTIEHADHYVAQMRTRHVFVDREERRALMNERVEALAKQAGGTPDRAEILDVENTTLVEEPFAVVGSFDPRFLALPASVIRAVARGHQRYYCVEKSEDELLPSYVAVVNTANRPDVIAKGMNRVMTARLSDASFFLEEDKKTDVQKRREKLKGLVFHNKLGSVFDKSERLVLLATHLAKTLGVAADVEAETLEAARDCKADLTSLMVGEFPELQGAMGRAYAKHAGRRDGVADALRDHYRPVGATDALAPTDQGRIVALADRLDTLVGCFGVGLQPSGAADPFALRRNCIALLRMLIEDDAKGTYGRLNLRALLGVAYDGYGRPLELTREAVIEKVASFAEERLRGLIASATSDKAAAFVLGGSDDHVALPQRTLAKAKGAFAVLERGDAWLEQAKTVAKRLSGISKDAKPVMHATLNPNRPEDLEIVRVVKQVDSATQALTSAAETEGALKQAETLATSLDGIFERTLVNDPADALTPRRLEVLSFGASCMLRLGDFSKLS